MFYICSVKRDHLKNVSSFFPIYRSLLTHSRCSFDLHKMFSFMNYATLLFLFSVKLAMSTKNSDLIQAAKDGNNGKVISSLREGSDINARDRYGNTPLLWASQYGHYEVCYTLIENEAKVNHLSKNGNSALMAASTRDHREVVRLLLEEGQADANAKMPGRDGPLHPASKHGHVDVVALLLEHGADVNALGFRERTPLHIACEYGRKNVVRLLLRHGANIRALNEDQQTPLDVAKLKVYPEIVRLLEDYEKASPESDDGDGCLDPRKLKNVTRPSTNATTDVREKNTIPKNATEEVSPIGTDPMTTVNETTRMNDLKFALSQLLELSSEVHNLAGNLNLLKHNSSSEIRLISNLNREFALVNQQTDSKEKKYLRMKDLAEKLNRAKQTETELIEKANLLETKISKLKVERERFYSEIGRLM